MMPERMKEDLQQLAEILTGKDPYRHGKITVSDLVREECRKLLEKHKDKLVKEKQKG